MPVSSSTVREPSPASSSETCAPGLSSRLGSLTVDDDTGIVDLGRLALAFRAANGPDGITGTPPIGNPDYRPGGVGSTVQLDPETIDQFWVDIRDGNLEPGEVGGLPS